MNEVTLQQSKYAIEIYDLKHRYDKSDWTLRITELLIEQSQHVAFVGPSGSGKSTLVDLLIGTQTPVMGRISINTHSPKQIVTQFPNYIGIVPQTVYMLNGSIIDNVTLLDVVEQSSIERIISIAKDLGLDEILGNPEALNSYTGERGVNLSGGQIQRIGILRALYREPKILILDESSSALDADNEKSVLDTIRKYLPDCTIISVAHRLSSIKDCDTIFYFTDGKIVADGNFEELVAKSPEFKRNVELLGMKTQLNRNN